MTTTNGKYFQTPTKTTLQNALPGCESQATGAPTIPACTSSQFSTP